MASVSVGQSEAGREELVQTVTGNDLNWAQPYATTHLKIVIALVVGEVVCRYAKIAN